MNDSRHLDFHASRGGRQSGDLYQGACRTRPTECLFVSAGNLVNICQIENIDNSSYDVAKLRSSLTKRRCNRGDCGDHLVVGITLEVVIAGRRSGDEDLVAYADRARIAVCVLERIARREICPDQRPFPPPGCFSRARA